MEMTMKRKNNFSIPKTHKFSVTLRENDTNSCTYRIDQKLFDPLKKYLEPFRSLQPKPRKIKC